MKVSNSKVTASMETQTMVEDLHSSVMNDAFYVVEEIDEDVTKDDINLSSLDLSSVEDTHNGYVYYILYPDTIVVPSHSLVCVVKSAIFLVIWGS